MSPSPSRLAGLLSTLVLALSALAVGTPVAAAESPEAAVDELVGMVRSGDLSGIGAVVCEERVDAVLERFDPSTALGLASSSAVGPIDMAVKIDDVEIELIDQEDIRASVRLSATQTVDIDEAAARDLVRALAQADGDQISDDDLDFVVPLMLATLSEATDIEALITLVRDEDRWLICGGLGVEQAGPVDLEQSVSFDGICGLIPLADVNAEGPPELQYGASFGGEDYCSYSSTSFDDYFSTTLSLDRVGALDDYRTIYPDGADTTIAGAPAYAQTDELFIQLPDGVLQISVIPSETAAAGFDTTTYLTRIAELFAPLIPELDPGEDAGSGSTDFGGVGQASLCEAIDVDQIASLSPLPFDEATGAEDYCSYSSSDPDAGYHVVNTSLDDLSLDDFRSFFPGGQDLTVAGLPAYAEAEQLWVQLDGDIGTFGVGAFIEGSPGADGLDARDLARQIVELAIPNIPVGEDDVQP